MLPWKEWPGSFWEHDQLMIKRWSYWVEHSWTVFGDCKNICENLVTETILVKAQILLVLLWIWTLCGEAHLLCQVPGTTKFARNGMPSAQHMVFVLIHWFVMSSYQHWGYTQFSDIEIQQILQQPRSTHQSFQLSLVPSQLEFIIPSMEINTFEMDNRLQLQLFQTSLQYSP